jgi:hypothetical protein
LGQRDDYLFYRKDLNEVQKVNEKGDEEHKSVKLPFFRILAATLELKCFLRANDAPHLDATTHGGR